MEELINNLIVELRRGTQMIAVLELLKEPQYGYSLLGVLESMQNKIEAGTLYPLLRRLEAQELINASWDTSDSRPKKILIINDKGKLVLNALKSEWKNMVSQIDNIINLGEKNE